MKQKNKKGLEFNMLIAIIIIIIGAVVLFPVISYTMTKVDDSSAPSICRGSVALRDASTKEFAAGTIKFTPVPFLCRTTDKTLKPTSKEQLKKDLSDMAAVCWWQFGEGMIEDPFREGNVGGSDSCFICNTFTIRETAAFSTKDPLESADLLTYMIQTPYKVAVDDNGIDCEAKKDDPACKNYDNLYECEKKGGICDYNCGTADEMVYDKWKCQNTRKCCIKATNAFSYVDYVQENKGVVVVQPKEFIPGEEYAILYAGQTSNCEWCKSTGYTLAIAGALAGCVKGGIVGGTAGTIIPGAGNIAGVIVGCVAGGGVGALAGILVNAVGTKVATEGGEVIVNWQGKKPSVQITRLTDVKKYCNIVSGVGGK